MVWLSKILVNTMGDPSKIYKEGLDPKHFIGKTMGFGLFLTITINSSLYSLASIGIAHTLNSVGLLPGSIEILSADRLNTFLLYSGFPSMMELRNANYTSAVKGPLLRNLNTEELTPIISFSFFFSTLFPINSGPKSNKFSACTNTFER